MIYLGLEGLLITMSLKERLAAAAGSFYVPNLHSVEGNLLDSVTVQQQLLEEETSHSFLNILIFLLGNTSNNQIVSHEVHCQLQHLFQFVVFTRDVVN